MGLMLRCQVRNAVPARTEADMEDAPKLLGLFEVECTTIWIRLPRSHRPKTWDELQELVNLFERSISETWWEDCFGSNFHRS